MGDVVEYQEVEEKILQIRGENILLDRDVAELYGVETKRINEAVMNNPDKFPEGYIITIDAEEWNSLRSKFSTLKNSAGRGQHTKYIPKAFTEKSLYMLATILKSPRATETTIAIVETFARMRELSRVVSQLPVVQDERQQKEIMQRTGEILTGILDDAMEVTGDETSIEINLAVMKITHKIKREKKKRGVPIQAS